MNYLSKKTVVILIFLDFVVQIFVNQGSCLDYYLVDKYYSCMLTLFSGYSWSWDKVFKAVA